MSRSAPLQQAVAASDIFHIAEIDVDGRRFLHRRSTPVPRHDRPTVLLIGGIALSGRYLLPVAGELARRFPVWVPDLPGFAASEATRTLTVPELADRLVDWMDAVEMERAAWVGNSMGAQVAVEAAVRHPDRVTSVILQGLTMDPAARTLARQVGRLALAAFHEPLSLGPLQVIDWLRTGPSRAAVTIRHALAHPVEERLPQVGCPALMVRGSLDRVVPDRWARQAADLLPHGEVRVLPAGTHTMTYTNALELARVVEAFLTMPAPQPHDPSSATKALPTARDGGGALARKQDSAQAPEGLRNRSDTT